MELKRSPSRNCSLHGIQPVFSRQVVPNIAACFMVSREAKKMQERNQMLMCASEAFTQKAA